MDAMHAAVKSKRKAGAPGLMDSEDEMGVAPEQAAPEHEGSGMSELVSKLSPEQKEELMQLLSAESESGDEVSSVEIEKGMPSSDEKQKIEAKMAKEKPPEDGYDDETSDDIAMSMVDRRDANKPEGFRPKNLGERARIGMAQKLKGKGKL